jgi:hypothetical protein
VEKLELPPRQAPHSYSTAGSRHPRVTKSPTMDIILDGSFTSPLANANLRPPTGSDSAGLLSSVYNGVSGWSAALTLLLAVVAYDQCERLRQNSPTRVAPADRHLQSATNGKKAPSLAHHGRFRSWALSYHPSILNSKNTKQNGLVAR